MRSLLALAALVLPLLVAPPAAAAPPTPAGRPDGYVSTRPGPGRFPVAERGRVAPVVVSTGDHAGVIRVADDLRADLHRVTGAEPGTTAGGRDPIVLGTVGKSPLIDRMVAAGRLDVRGLAGRWETTVEQIVEHPLPGVRRAFVIAGSDQRGTIYGAYDLSKRIGVSPWHVWDDVPVRHHDALYAPRTTPPRPSTASSWALPARRR